MYFRKSADIAEAHQTLAPHIEEIDAILYSTGDHPLRADLLSDHLGIEQPLLQRILQLYAKAGTLREEQRRYCNACETLIDEEDSPTECDNCETKFAKLPPQTCDVFTPTNPVIRVEVDDSNDDTRVVRVQFVGGDRGGGTKAQLQVPKEDTAIKSALKGTDLAEKIELGAAIHAASMTDLCSLYTKRPNVLHFAGHGDERSLSFIRDQELLADVVAVTADKLAKILAAFPEPVTLAVFNTCNSATIAKLLVEEKVLEIATGWDGKVPDSVAIAFASQFYLHTGNGLAVGSAFTLAAEAATPDGANYSATIFAQPGIVLNSHYLLGP